MMYWHDFSWWMVFGMIFMVLFWGSIIWLVVWGIQRATHRSHSPSNMSPLDIAKERYAKGEITREQFEQFKKDL
jgi:putative membrane protein